MTTIEKKKVQGSCHCGAIKYAMKVTTNPETGAIDGGRCNCTFCQKLGITGVSLSGPDDFDLLTSPEKSELGQYAPRVKTLPRYFCKTCGVHVWMDGYFEIGGNRHNLFTVNIATVDQPQEGIDLSRSKIKYVDGLHDNFGAGSRDGPWPNGLI